MLILQTEEEREVRKAEQIKEAKRRLLLSMVEAGKRKAFMASVLHVDVEELDEMIKAARMEAYNKKHNLGDQLLFEWDQMHRAYVRYRQEHPKKSSENCM